MASGKKPSVLSDVNTVRLQHLSRMKIGCLSLAMKQAGTPQPYTSLWLSDALYKIGKILRKALQQMISLTKVASCFTFAMEAKRLPNKGQYLKKQNALAYRFAIIMSRDELDSI